MPAQTSYQPRLRYFIDSNKCLTGAVVLALMACQQAWDSPVAWLYLAEHGLYGFLWAYKSQTFADKQFERRVSWSMGAGAFGVLCLYYIAPFLITRRHVAAPPWVLALSVFLYALGIFFHFASDMQKFMHLKYRAGTLLTDGLWARSRNPNYFGELLIYSAFTMLARSPVAFLPLGLMIALVWIPNIHRKEKSLQRYAEFAAWKQRSGLLFPSLRRRAA